MYSAAQTSNVPLQYFDARGFRKTLQSDIDQFHMKSADKRAFTTIDSYVADSRYPALSAVMSDARQFTDYRTHCSANIAPEAQYKTKQWMIDNATQLIEKSRFRQAERLGATDAVAQITGPGASVIQNCTVDNCTIQSTGDLRGIGIERVNTWSQHDIPLFGTFSYAPVTSKAAFDAPLLTVKQEGGRNSIRR